MGAGKLGRGKAKTANGKDQGPDRGFVFGTLSLQDVLAIALNIGAAHFSGVYFLILGEQIVYIGSSVLLPARLAVHLRHRRMKFDRIAFVLCPKAGVRRLEAAYIVQFDPIYNRLHIEGGRAKSIKPLEIPPHEKPSARLFMSRAEATNYLTSKGIPMAEQTLARLSHVGRGPDERMLGRKILYHRDDLDSWAKGAGK